MTAGNAIMLFCFIFLAFGLMVAGYALKKAVLATAASVAWFLLGILAFTQVVTMWDIFYCLFVFGMALSLVSILEIFGIARSEQVEAGKEEREEKEEDMDYAETRRELEGRRALRGGRSARRLPPPKPSNYSQTGTYEERR